MFWTVLILTYYVEEYTIHSDIYFRDMKTLWIPVKINIPWAASDIIYPVIAQHHEFSMSRCRETDLMLSEFKQRPKLRSSVSD